MRSLPSIGEFIQDFIFGLSKFQDGLRFIRTHQLWKGIWSYGWLAKIMLAVSFFIGLKFLSIFLHWIRVFSSSEVQALGANMMGFFQDIYHEGENLFLMGGLKYVILILTEVMVFHFVRKTSEILTGKEQNASFNAFIQAQVRMIKVVVRSWILELIWTILISVAVGLIGFEWLKAPLVFFIQCFFLGFAIVDNYLERYEVQIKESIDASKRVAGAVVAVGLITYLLLLIPIIGAFVAPFVAG
ncbi:MAG: hypothetical protein KDC44_20390, partial [Phaeodactylibacter sp.]|nr:hypothetical protein [Phaeodactylibacter sp.]